METPARKPPSLIRSTGWTIEWHECVTSTQTLARGRGVGSAVAAGAQTAGRGQGTRKFVSDPGGLYVTAVLPYPGDPLETRGFALAVGWALRESLREAGVRGLRLRWPNDLMIGERKVGGILLEQDGPGTLLVGVGLNVANRPWLSEPALLGEAGRLVDAVAGGVLPDRQQLAGRVLQAIETAHVAFAEQRLAGFAERLNGCWGDVREVVIEPAGGVEFAEQRGFFQGIDGDGRVCLETARGEVIAIPPHLIGRLREIA